MKEILDSISWYADILRYKVLEEHGWRQEQWFDYEETDEGYEATLISPDIKVRKSFSEPGDLMSFYNRVVKEDRADTRIGDFEDGDLRPISRKRSAGFGGDGDWVVDVWPTVGMWWDEDMDEVENATEAITSGVLEEVTHAHSDYVHDAAYAVVPDTYSDLRGIQRDIEKYGEVEQMEMRGEALIATMKDIEEASGLLTDIANPSKEPYGNLKNTEVGPIQQRDEGDEVFREMAEYVSSP